MAKHFILGLIVLLLATLIYPVIVSPTVMQACITADYTHAVRIFGDKSRLDQQLTQLYQVNLSAIRHFADEFKARNDDAQWYRNRGDTLGNTIAVIPEYWSQALKLQAYNLALRLVIIKFWMGWLVVPVGVGITTGLLIRKLKFATFSPPIPPIYNSCTHALLATLLLTSAWLLCPLPIPITTIPTVVGLLCLMVSAAIANYPFY